MLKSHSAVREGVIGGVLSATVIVAWFFIVDMIAGRLFFTPAVLGRGLLGIAGLRAGDTMVTYVSVYTVFHYLAFIIMGIIVASVAHAARRTPSILAGFLILFVAFEIGFHGLVSMLSINTDLEGLAWIQIMVANLIASVVMFYYMWSRHPELGREFEQALSGNDV